MPSIQLLGGEVYHYHTKLIMKEAHTGGSFVWHQDYGFARDLEITNYDFLGIGTRMVACFLTWVQYSLQLISVTRRMDVCR